MFLPRNYSWAFPSVLQSKSWKLTLNFYEFSLRLPSYGFAGIPVLSTKNLERKVSFASCLFFSLLSSRGSEFCPGTGSGLPLPTDSYRFLQKMVKGETSRRCSRWPVLNLDMTTVRGRIEANALQCMGLLQAGSCQRAKAKLILNWWCWGLDIDKTPCGVSGISAMLKADTWRGVRIKTISGHKNS